MDDQSYLQHCLDTWRAFADTFVTRTQSLDERNPLRELALGCRDAGRDSESLYAEGPSLVTRLFTTFPEFAPTLPRELLWFLGGECLHYLADEEIALYQELEDSRSDAAARGEVIDLEEARAKLLKSR